MAAIDLNTYSQLFDAMPVAALLINDRGRCVDANSHAVELLGTDILNPTWNAFESDTLRCDELDRLVDSLRSKNSVPVYDATLLGPSGSRLVRISGHRVFNDLLGEYLTWVVLVEVTDTSAPAYRIAQINRQLEESNRQLDQFASMAAHDLKAPARRVRMFAQLLDNDVALSESSREFLDRIRISGAQMEDIIDSLLEFARVGSEHETMQPTDLRTAIQRTCADLAPEIEEVGYEVTLSGVFPTVSVSEVAAEQLIHNLISNAIKFRRQDEEGVLTISSNTDSDQGNYILTFSDNGVGFPDEHAEQLFEMLYRAHAKSEFEGHGIGLPICRRICWAHGWTISAHSPDEHGATFQIVIPHPDPDDYHRH